MVFVSWRKDVSVSGLGLSKDVVIPTNSASPIVGGRVDSGLK